MMCAMRQSAYSSFEGIDISPTSVEMTRALLGSGAFGDFADYEIVEQDFFGRDMGERNQGIEKPSLRRQRACD